MRVLKGRMAGAVAAVYLAAVAMSCRGHVDEATQDAEAAVDSDAYAAAMGRLKGVLSDTVAMKDGNDSLCYYLGYCEGLVWRRQMVGVGDSVRADSDDYMLGLYTTLKSDTVSMSYADGVLAGAKAARYLDHLEESGVKFNRELLVKTILEMLDNTPSEDWAVLEADSISNMLIMRQR